jgi:hypothetical protein
MLSEEHARPATGKKRHAKSRVGVRTGASDDMAGDDMAGDDMEG